MAKIITLITTIIFSVMFASDLAFAVDEAAKSPPAKPANHAGRTTCLGCHKDGVGGAKKIPENHAGRTDATCSGCHKDSK